jgi:hypothetical protein
MEYGTAIAKQRDEIAAKLAEIKTLDQAMTYTIRMLEEMADGQGSVFHCVALAVKLREIDQRMRASATQGAAHIPQAPNNVRSAETVARRAPVTPEAPPGVPAEEFQEFTGEGEEDARVTDLPALPAHDDILDGLRDIQEKSRQAGYARDDYEARKPRAPLPRTRG